MSNRHRVQYISRFDLVQGLLEGHNVLTDEQHYQLRGSDGNVDGPWNRWDSRAAFCIDRVNTLNAKGDFTTASPCEHFKLLRSDLPGVVTYPWSLFPWQGKVTYRFNGSAPGPGASWNEVSYETMFPSPPTSSVTSFAFQCLNEMSSQFPEEVDIINFLIDLKEIPALIYNIHKLRTEFAEAIGKDIDHRTIKEVAKIVRDNARNQHLEFNFGWAPLIGDIKKLVKIVDTVDRRIQWLKKNRNKWVRVGSQSSFSNSDRGSIQRFGVVGAPSLGYQRVSTRGRLYCTGMVKQDFDWLDSAEAFVRGFMSAGGVNKPLSVIWERIPMSWVVDYLVPVGDFLGSMSIQDIGWLSRDVTWSFKSDYQFRMALYDEMGAEIKSCGSFSYQRYTRHVGFPPRDWYVKVPTAKQLTLLAAVAV